MTDAELLALAKTAAENAYAPYSNFRVGAALIAEDGTVYTGANVENAAYPSGLCAEAVAIGHAVASGARSLDMAATICLDGHEPCFPCGNCRQRMREFGVKRLVVESPGGGAVVHDFNTEVLPNSFGPESLGQSMALLNDVDGNGSRDLALGAPRGVQPGLTHYRG